MLKVSGWLAALTGAVLLVAGFGASPGRAADRVWLEAQTPHFLIYSDGSEAVLRDYAEKLEVLDGAFWETWGLQRPPMTGRRLPIYLVDDTDLFQQVAPGVPKATAGFYYSGPNITFAMGMSGAKRDDVVLHEYAHHLMLAHFPGAYPAWLVEGYASYFEGTDVDDKVVQVGRASSNAGGMTYATWIKIDDLVSKRPSDFGEGMLYRYYAQSWLMTHYFLSDPRRAQQLKAYLEAVSAGQPSAKALQDATGMTPLQMEKTLTTYATRPLSMLQFKRSQFPPATVNVRRLSPAEGALLIDGVGVKALTTPKDAFKATLARIKSRAAPYPDDPFAQDVLARAEHYFGDRDIAEAILKRRLAADPKDTEAMAVYADLLMDKGDDLPAAQKVELYNQAGALLATSFRIDPNNYATLNDFALSRRLEPGFPSDNALTAQLTAAKLAPQVGEIRLSAAASLIQRKRYREARALLAPLVASPHDTGAVKAAQQLLAQIPPDAS